MPTIYYYLSDSVYKRLLKVLELRVEAGEPALSSARYIALAVWRAVETDETVFSTQAILREQ